MGQLAFIKEIYIGVTMVDLCFIIPIYNKSIYAIDRCINSVLEVKNNNFNTSILMVDDGSDKDIADYCDLLSGRHEKILCVHQQNKGASGARNTGIDSVTADYLYFVDADDALDIEGFNRLDLPCSDITFTDITVDNGNISEKWKAFPGEKINGLADIIKKLTKDGKLNGPVGKIIKVDFLKKNNIRFPEKVITGEDAIFLMDIVLGKPTVNYQPVNTYIYYLDECTSTNRLMVNTEKFLDDIISVYLKMQITINTILESDLLKNSLGINASERATKQLFNCCCELLLMNKFEKEIFETKFRVINGIDLKRWKCKERLQYILLRKKLYCLIWMIAILRKIYLGR